MKILLNDNTLTVTSDDDKILHFISKSDIKRVYYTSTSRPSFNLASTTTNNQIYTVRLELNRGFYHIVLGSHDKYDSDYRAFSNKPTWANTKEGAEAAVSDLEAWFNPVTP